ncbi:hypothetical protein [Lutibacter sp. B1]|uniref:hypothetical protein n=1 Tax=Lutibacter sp. B1 TaxID=2725996 RepID=UPI0014566B13|nr:hypothetical protein [Lutibacter sp. B1]NLP58997.1 hypothetical protein [Lutibacter sp. B1]
MKLLIVTSVDQFQSDVLKLFKKAQIENFSGSEIDGYKNIASLMMTRSWFPSEKTGAESSLFFSFTDEEKIQKLFDLIEVLNESLETNNPIKAVVVPIKKFI